jgi:uncharacterized protein YjiS (DUF1127 family)
MSQIAYSNGAVHDLPTATAFGPQSKLWATMRRRFANWRRRGRLTQLETLDDRVLEDIGLKRADLSWARYLPLDRDPLQALNILAVERRREQREAMGTRLARRFAR